MFESLMKFFKRKGKKEEKATNSKEAAKERLHLVLMQDRANVSADFLELMKQEIIEVIKKYIDVDESAIDVRLTNKENEDGTNGAPALYANIPILNIKNEARKVEKQENKKEETTNSKKQEENENEKNKKKETIEENKKTENNEKIEEVIEEAKIIIDEETEKNDNKEETKENQKENKENKEKTNQKN